MSKKKNNSTNSVYRQCNKTFALSQKRERLKGLFPLSLSFRDYNCVCVFN